MRVRWLAIGCMFVIGILVGAGLLPLVPLHPVAPALADPDQSKPSAVAIRGAYPADLLRVVDGDTFEARVRVWPGLDLTTKVRLRGIDAPELNARCSEERSKAEVARDALSAILVEGDITVLDVGIDKYGGRVLAAAATRRTPNVSVALLDKGVARAYWGGRRDSWCPS